MQPSDFTTPVLFLVFNRPALTKKVFEAIRAVRPSKLFIAADGPRDNYNGEELKCQEVRDIATAVDWKCEVRLLFRDKNMGCAKAVSSAISWFFSFVDEGIILEDDCLPSRHFFFFCSDLLEKYRYDTRIMQIAGSNLNADEPATYSYFFSNHNFIWGWATWRRAWKFYDPVLSLYGEISRKKYHSDYFYTFDERDYYEYVWDEIYVDTEHASTWDYQWQFTRMLQYGLAIVPQRNLIVNIGVGEDATHCTHDHDIVPGQVHEAMEFPLKHPEFVMVNRARDARIFNGVFTTPWSRVKQRLKRVIPASVLDYRHKLLRRKTK